MKCCFCGNSNTNLTFLQLLCVEVFVSSLKRKPWPALLYCVSMSVRICVCPSDEPSIGKVAPCTSSGSAAPRSQSTVGALEQLAVSQ